MTQDTASICLGLLEDLKSLLLSPDFKDRHRQDKKHFTRKRCLTFIIVIVFLLNLVKRSLQDELDEFFKLFNNEDVAIRIVTKSAFTQARKKLKYQAFAELNGKQVSYFYNHFKVQTWHGFRLVAVDGSTSELPRTAQVIEHFGVWHPAQGNPCPVARVSQMFDPINKVTLDAIIAPKAQGERVLAAQHFIHLKVNDLVLVDRGYPAFWLFALILKQDAQFCARMPLSGWHVVEQFVASGLPEQIVILHPGAQARKECQARQLSTKPLTVRLIRIELNTGEIEVLATSLLDVSLYPISIFKELYHQRWPVEEGYKVMKSRIEIENFTGTSKLAVYQDFYAKVFTMNLTAILAHPAQEVVRKNSQEKKYVYQVNMANALTKMKDTIVLLFQRTTILQILNRLWRAMTQVIEPIRPGRSYPHKKRVTRPRFPVAYKPLR
jgi:hypothetical protein